MIAPPLTTRQSAEFPEAAPNVPAAIGVGAAIFALFHLAYGGGAIVTFVAGCVLGWARERSGILRAPIAAHAMNNAIVLGLPLFFA